MINVAIIGAGAIAGVHADAYHQFAERCKVVAVVDMFENKAQSLIEKHNLKDAKPFKTMEEALTNEKVDLVSICLPPSAHAENTIKALKAGCHVIVEKPMANSLEECDSMIDEAHKARKILSVVCQNRFKTPMMRVHKLLEEQITGKVTHAIINSLWWRGPNYYDIWWRGKWSTECGGCFTSHSVHHIDLLIWILGMPKTVTAVIGNVAHHNSEQEDVGVAILGYPDKFVQLTSSIVDYGEAQEMIFQTENARLSIPWSPAASIPAPNGFPIENTKLEEKLNKAYQDIPELSIEGHPALILNVLKAITGEENLLATGEDGRRAVELIMAIYKSAALHKTVALPIQKDDDFYRKETMVANMPHFFEKTKSIENFSSSEITLGRDMGK